MEKAKKKKSSNKPELTHLLAKWHNHPRFISPVFRQGFFYIHTKNIDMTFKKPHLKIC
jgi:hypothetical protein